MAQQIASALTILRRRQVEARTGLARSSIYRGIAAGSFPRPIKIGARSSGWLESEINEWLARQVAASREQAAA
jgi:prophage regulatory protein